MCWTWWTSMFLPYLHFYLNICNGFKKEASSKLEANLVWRVSVLKNMKSTLLQNLCWVQSRSKADLSLSHTLWNMDWRVWSELCCKISLGFKVDRKLICCSVVLSLSLKYGLKSVKRTLLQNFCWVWSRLKVDLSLCHSLLDMDQKV